GHPAILSVEAANPEFAIVFAAIREAFKKPGACPSRILRMHMIRPVLRQRLAFSAQKLPERSINEGILRPHRSHPQVCGRVVCHRVKPGFSLAEYSSLLLSPDESHAGGVGHSDQSRNQRYLPRQA